MIRSMTGFASRTGGNASFSWVIELRSVNAKGLDIRLRLPEQLSALDPVIRAAIQKRAARGNVSLSVRLERGEGQASLSLDEAALATVVEAARHANDVSAASGLVLDPATPAQLLSIPGVMRRSEGDEADVPVEAIKTDVEAALDVFGKARDAEGANLAGILSRQLDDIAVLTAKARDAAQARRPKMEASLTENLARVAATAGEVGPDRVAQELALLAVKADVTEEIDRLKAHVDGARALLAEDAPVGRRLDFLMQEFNREANTLCAKSADSALTQAGLDLKVLIDQMREQVQNVE